MTPVHALVYLAVQLHVSIFNHECCTKKEEEEEEERLFQILKSENHRCQNIGM